MPPNRPALPPSDHLATAGAAVQRLLERAGHAMPTQRRRHVALRDRETGHVLVLPLPDGLITPTIADLARQAGIEHDRLRELL